LIVEDDFTSRLLLQEILKRYGAAHVAVNGREAVEAVSAALAGGQAYDLVCLDIMMPEMDGYEALEKIRGLESAWGIQPSRGVKVLVTTALDRVRNVAQAFRGLCDAYLVKPIDAAMLQEQLRKFELI
jgi:two-component system, chemotaxis family, chemotaxis protein CheY